MRRDGSAYVVQVDAGGREMLAKNLGKRKKENFFDYYKYMYIYKNTSPRYRRGVAVQE